MCIITAVLVLGTYCLPFVLIAKINPDQYGYFETDVRVFASKLAGVLNPECHEDRLQTPDERESVKAILDRILDVYPADANAITVIRSLYQKYLSTSSADRHALFKKRNSSFNQVKNAHDALLRANTDLKRKVSILTTDKNSLEDQLVEMKQRLEAENGKGREGYSSFKKIRGRESIIEIGRYLKIFDISQPMIGVDAMGVSCMS